MVSTPAGMVTESNAESFWKQAPPIWVIVLGSWIDVRLRHSEKAKLPIDVTPSGSVTVCSAVQDKKHWSPMVVTEEGMDTDTSALSSMKQ